MAILTKLVSGIMHEDNFDNYSLLWELSPNDFNRVEFGNGKVGLEHGDERISMSIPTPSETYVFQANITHEPKTLSDIGGILVSSITDNSIECQTYFSSGAGGEQYFKYIKVCVDKGVYTFHSSKDGILWRVLGNAELPEANRIGFFLDGISTIVSEKFFVHSVSIYKSNIITINNIPLKSVIKVLDKDGNDVIANKYNVVNHYGNKAYLDLTNVMFPITNANIQVFDGDIKIVDIFTDVCGGDIYECSEDIAITVDNTPVDMNTVYDLGSLKSSSTVYVVTIKNKDLMPLVNKKLSIVAYSSYNRGDTCASLAIVPESGTALDYQKQLELPILAPDSSMDIYMKVDKDVSNLGPFLADKYKFKVILE